MTSFYFYVHQITTELGLNELRERTWQILPCSAKTGEGLQVSLFVFVHSFIYQFIELYIQLWIMWGNEDYILAQREGRDQSGLRKEGMNSGRDRERRGNKRVCQLSVSLQFCLISLLIPPSPPFSSPLFFIS